MKKIDIQREMGFIDPEFIVEAANYRHKKISKLKIVALAACLAILVTAIPLTLIMNREDQVEMPDRKSTRLNSSHA